MTLLNATQLIAMLMAAAAFVKFMMKLNYERTHDADGNKTYPVRGHYPPIRRPVEEGCMFLVVDGYAYMFTGFEWARVRAHSEEA